jgi:hypothetical protein
LGFCPSKPTLTRVVAFSSARRLNKYTSVKPFESPLLVGRMLVASV